MFLSSVGLFTIGKGGMRYLTEVKALVLEVSLIFTKSMNVNN